jgi:hypothetical protein
MSPNPRNVLSSENGFASQEEEVGEIHKRKSEPNPSHAEV